MSSHIMVWDLETIPELDGFARANNLVGKPDQEIRLAMGEEFPKLIYHSIISIGALVASRTVNGYEVKAVGAPAASLKATIRCRSTNNNKSSGQLTRVL